MVDACEVRRVTGSVTDPDTGAVSPSYSVVYSGPCKMQSTPGAAAGQSPEAGEHAFIVQALQLHVPVSAGPIVSGDVVVVTSAVNDAQLAGRTYRVTGEHHKTWATAQRLPIEEVQG
jgi:hypothetical protein